MSGCALLRACMGDWEVVDAKRCPYHKVHGDAEWTVDVPAGGELQVDYRVRVRL